MRIKSPEKDGMKKKGELLLLVLVYVVEPSAKAAGQKALQMTKSHSNRCCEPQYLNWPVSRHHVR